MESSDAKSLGSARAEAADRAPGAGGALAAALGASRAKELVLGVAFIRAGPWPGSKYMQ